MAKESRKLTGTEGNPTVATSLEAAFRLRARAWIDAIVEEAIEAALGARVARVGAERYGYRHGTRERPLTTSLGPTTFAMPRARVMTSEGGTAEWRSAPVSRDQRRSQRVAEAILGVYLCGTSTRIKSALTPLLRGGPLSKDAVTRLVGRLAEDFETWRRRDLGGDQIQYLSLDGWYPKLRIGTRRVRVPVLVTLGVRGDGDGERVVLDVRLAGDERTVAWRDVIRTLVDRHVGTVRLAMIDGSAGLAAALREQWPSQAIQRCTAPKPRNLEAKAPACLREELAEDYRRLIDAETRALVNQARAQCTKKWPLRYPAVVESLHEAGDDLFIFLSFPKAQWTALRTTNALERINGEFRRRTKTQARLPSQAPVLLRLFGLVRSGQVKMPKIDGWHEMEHAKQAA